jgi:hypothetical protein
MQGAEDQTPPLDRVFYELTVRQRDAAWQEVERLEAALAQVAAERDAAPGAEVERLTQALSFARGTLEDIGSSLVPLKDRDELARRARAALVTLDDLLACRQ